MDDPFVSCPFNSKHRVPRSRIQIHIAKCQVNYPEFLVCPYNATHRYKEDDIRAHVQNCPSKDVIFSENHPPHVLAAVSKPKPILEREYLPITDPNHEMWDN